MNKVNRTQHAATIPQGSVIWKFELDAISYHQTLLMPKDAVIISCQPQKETLCIWAVVDPLRVMEERHFRIYTTGSILSPLRSIFIDTFQVPDGDKIHVGHLFEVLLKD